MTITNVDVATLRQRLAEKALRRAVANKIAAAQMPSVDFSGAATATPQAVQEAALADGLISLAISVLSEDRHDERQPLVVMSLSPAEVKHFSAQADSDLSVMLAPDAIAAARVVAFFEAAGMSVLLQPKQPYLHAPALSRDQQYQIVVSQA